MKRILAALILLTSAANMFADVTVYGEVKGSATANFSDDYYAEDYEGDTYTGDDSEMEARIGIKGTNGVTSFRVELKAADGGPANSGDKTLPWFEYGYIKTDVAEYFGLDGFIFDVTAGLVKLEGLRKARYTTYENEDFPTLKRSKNRETTYKFQIKKNTDAPTVLLDAGIDLVRFRGGINGDIINATENSLAYMAGLAGGIDALNYEAYYMNNGLVIADEEAGEDDAVNYEDAVMASVWYDSLEVASMEAEFGASYMFSIDDEIHSFGGGATITEETFLPIELSLAIDGAYSVETEKTYLYDLAIELDTEVTDWFNVLAGSVIDLRDYSELTTAPSPLRLIELCLNFTFGKTTFGIGRVQTFDTELLSGYNSGAQSAESMFAYAEDGIIPHFYINVKSKF